jgi:ubiquinone/menaquinone biosynthesis C-methylase UbiE
MKLFYQIGYKYFRMPWDIGARQELVELVESERIKPCRAIDLGSGTASNVVFLAQHGFDVTGVDYAASAIELGHKRAKQAGVEIEFIQDDLTNLQHVTGTFDFLAIPAASFSCTASNGPQVGGSGYFCGSFSLEL